MGIFTHFSTEKKSEGRPAVSSKLARQVDFIRAERSSNGSGCPGHFALEPTSAVSLRMHVDACRTPNLAETQREMFVEFLIRLPMDRVPFVLFSLRESVPPELVTRHG